MSALFPPALPPWMQPFATFTPRLNLAKPDVGGDVDVWGSQLNANMDVLDQAVRASGDTMTGGLSFGSAFIPLNRDNLSRHLALYGTAIGSSVGFSVTSGNFNYVAPATWFHAFRTGGADRFFIGDNGVFMGANLQLTLALDPTGATHATTKRYVDAGDVAAQNNVGRNLIHNAMMRVQQRGQGLWTTNGAYTVDRWLLESAGTGTPLSIGVASMSDANRADIGDEEARTCLDLTVTGTAGFNDYALIAQRIENVARLAGKTVTVSFYANANVASFRVGASIDQQFGAGGSAGVLGTGQSVALSATVAQFNRYSLTFNVPSIAGATIGPNGDSHTDLNLWLSAATAANTRSGGVGIQSGIVNLWGIQLEIGTVASKLEKRDPATDLALCQRFYQLSNGPITVGGACYENTSIVNPWTFPVPMRVAPTVAYGLSGGFGYTNPTVGGITTMGFAGMATATVTGEYIANANWFATADL